MEEEEVVVVVMLPAFREVIKTNARRRCLSSDFSLLEPTA